ncbi:MAG: ATP-binding cassette, subfamily er 3 [Candidatus Poribacteria bacterium]|nr:ATP-binding cassette, subfamily er 3 [Candidatus Poribacteria bacterium]
MLLASFQNVTMRYSIQTVLQNVSFKISTGEKLGFIGANGSGKTTILRILMGQEYPSEGSAVLTNGIRIGYVPQYVEYKENDTVLEYIIADHLRLSNAIHEQEQRLANASTDQMDKIIKAYERLCDQYNSIYDDNYPQRARAMLNALGLGGKEDQKIGSLSGGEKNVLSLTQALLAKPDLLLLDEPDNHLDYLGIAWLEDFLNRFNGAAVIVSHNRYLLDRVANGILQLENGKVTYYDGGYSDYRATRLRELLAQQSDYIANQKRLAQLEARVKQFELIARTNSDPAWGKRLRAMRSQLEREKSQSVEKPTLGESTIRTNFATEATRANIALEINDYNKAFDDLKLFENADVHISCGECVALVGPNGCGKTTLLRDIVEHGAWDNHTIRIGPSLRIGYCSQEQEVFQGNGTILDEIMSTSPMTRDDAIGVLSKFLFKWDDTQKLVKNLSGGERNRLQLARMMVLKPNFLILDEPTNHLDIPTCEAVEEALENFNGTLLVVSHDRYFLDKIVNRVIEIRDRKLFSYPGNFTDFWYARQRSMPRVVGHIATRGKHRERPETPRMREKALTTLEKRITEAEQEKLALEQRVAEALAKRNQREGRRVSKQLDQLKAQIDDLYEKWIAEQQ